MRKKKGFTLVELMAAIGITAIFGIIILGISTTAGRLFGLVQTDSGFNDKARVIMGSIEDDLKTAKNIKGTSSGDVTSIEIDGEIYSLPGLGGQVILSYTKKEGTDQIAYAYIHTNGNELVKIRGNSSTLIGNKVSGGFSEINRISIVNQDIVGDNKRYRIEIEFLNDRDDSSIYSNVITPRNSLGG